MCGTPRAKPRVPERLIPQALKGRHNLRLAPPGPGARHNRRGGVVSPFQGLHGRAPWTSGLSPQPIVFRPFQGSLAARLLWHRRLIALPIAAITETTPIANG